MAIEMYTVAPATRPARARPTCSPSACSTLGATKVTIYSNVVTVEAPAAAWAELEPKVIVHDRAPLRVLRRRRGLVVRSPRRRTRDLQSPVALGFASSRLRSAEPVAPAGRRTSVVPVRARPGACRLRNEHMFAIVGSWSPPRFPRRCPGGTSTPGRSCGRRRPGPLRRCWPVIGSSPSPVRSVTFSRRAVFGAAARLRSMGLRVRGRRPLRSSSPRPPPP